MPFPSVPLLDDFNRADENPLAGNWTFVDFGAFAFVDLQLLSDEVTAAPDIDSKPGSDYWTPDTFGPAVAAAFTLAADLKTFAGVTFLTSLSPVDGYFVANFSDGNHVLRIDAGVITDLGAQGVPLLAGQQFGATLLDGVLTSYADGVPSGSWADATYSSPTTSLGLAVSAFDTVDDYYGGKVHTPHIVTCKIYDLASNELADISAIALERTLKRRLNQARSFTITAPAGDPLLTTVADDGYPNLRHGNRKLLVWEDGTIIFHGRIFTVERVGDGKQNLVTITAFDPWMELGYESEDRAGRPVRDDTGNFSDPTFVPSVGGNTPESAISGPDLIQQILTNSQNTDPLLGEGPLPISLTGTFDLAVPPAVDLSVIDKMDYPVLVGDFIQQLVETGAVDVDMRPVDPSEGFDPYIMVELSAVSLQGTDRSDTVHFDYWTGDHNASACRHVADFSTINNKLFFFLGIRRNKEHWLANIAPDSPDVTVDPTASRALYGGPDSAQFMGIQVYDSIGTEDSSRPLYLALYNAEFGYRVEPRQLLFITPAPDAKALYEPPHDFDVGDPITINVDGDFGLALAEVQRVYGYDRSWDRQNVAHVSQLLTSADPG